MERSALETIDRRAVTGSTLLLGLWMRAAFVGGALAAAGVVSVIDPPQGVSFVMAFTWIVAGATFAWLAWQRAVALLHPIDTNGACGGVEARRCRMALGSDPLRRMIPPLRSKGQTS